MKKLAKLSIALIAALAAFVFGVAVTYFLIAVACWGLKIQFSYRLATGIVAILVILKSWFAKNKGKE